MEHTEMINLQKQQLKDFNSTKHFDNYNNGLHDMQDGRGDYVTPFGVQNCN